LLYLACFAIKRAPAPLCTGSAEARAKLKATRMPDMQQETQPKQETDLRKLPTGYPHRPAACTSDRPGRRGTRFDRKRQAQSCGVGEKFYFLGLTESLIALNIMQTALL
jgi:hypothetical protein